MNILVAVLFGVMVMLLIFLVVEPMFEGATKARDHLMSQARTSMADMFMFIDLQKLVTLSLALIFLITFFLYLATGSIILPLIAAVILSFSPGLILKFLKKRRRTSITNQLPDFLSGIASSMSVGMGLNQSIEVTSKEEGGAIRQEFDLFLNELRLGVKFEDALDNLMKRVETVEMQLVVAAMRISREVGGNLSEVLKRLADTIRTKIEMENKIKTLTAQGRMQGLVMLCLPIMVGAALYFMEATHIYMVELFTRWYGWLTLLFLGSMLFVGYFFIRKIVNIDV